MECMFEVYPYEAPTWARHLNCIPTQQVKLSQLKTPIHEWRLPGVDAKFKLSIKRDDLTGAELSGSKVRGLQLLFGEALAQGVKHVVTGGGIQSGHCRAVALVCRMLGLQPHVLIEAAASKEDLAAKGNTLLYRLAGSQIYLSPPGASFYDFRRRVSTLATYISEAYDEACYHITVGGTTTRTIYGYLTLFQELLDQGLREKFDDIVVTVATGGTCAGLAIGNYLTGNKLRVHAVTIARPKADLESDIDSILLDIGLTGVAARNILDIIEGYVGDGYGTATEQVLEFITQVSSSSGILLDPYYTGKGAMGLVGELNDNPGRFQGNRILFVHTGGLFGLFNGEMDRVVDKENNAANNMTEWPIEEESRVKK